MRSLAGTYSLPKAKTRETRQTSQRDMDNFEDVIAQLCNTVEAFDINPIANAQSDTAAVKGEGCIGIVNSCSNSASFA